MLLPSYLILFVLSYWFEEKVNNNCIRLFLIFGEPKVLLFFLT